MRGAINWQLPALSNFKSLRKFCPQEPFLEDQKNDLVKEKGLTGIIKWLLLFNFKLSLSVWSSICYLFDAEKYETEKYKTENYKTE